MKDGERGSYPELVDVLTEHGANAASDAEELYRRMTFNVLISNVDDHQRNHGFLWTGRHGWSLSADDLNPTPKDVRPRVLTSLSLDDPTCDLDLVLSVAEYLGLGSAAARAIVKQVGAVTNVWRDVATSLGASSAEIRRMASAFEHEDLTKALAL